MGAMAEYFVTPATGVRKVPDSVSDEEAAMLDPINTALGGIGAAGLRLGESLAVIGAGRIGLGTMLCAKTIGAAPVIVIDVIKSRLDKALEMGADAVLNANEVDVISEVVKLTEAGPNAVIICAREAKVLNQAVDMVRRGGIVVITGWGVSEDINPTLWSVRQITVTGKLVHPGSTTLPMDLVAQRRVNVKPIISAIMPLEDIQRAFDSMYSGENIGVLLKP